MIDVQVRKGKFFGKRFYIKSHTTDKETWFFALHRLKDVFSGAAGNVFRDDSIGMMQFLCYALIEKCSGCIFG